MSGRLTNTFKAWLQAGDLQWGLWFGLANNVAAEICAQSGFDWLLIDAEHSPLSDRDVLGCLQAVAPYAVSPIVRPVSADKNGLKRLADVGVQTFLIPMVDDAQTAASVVDAVRYPSDGTRGLGTSMARAARWNMAPDYIATANAQICVIVQIETVAGLENLESIATVDGVDAVFIGPSDLGAALGYPGQPDHPDVVAAVANALRRVRACGKPAGVLAVTPELVNTYREAGASFIGVGSDCGVLAKGTARLFNTFSAGADADPDPDAGADAGRDVRGDY